MVIEMLACPSNSWTSLGCAPLSSSRVAHVCRRSWKRTFCEISALFRSLRYGPPVRDHGRIALPHTAAHGEHEQCFMFVAACGLQEAFNLGGGERTHLFAGRSRRL